MAAQAAITSSRDPTLANRPKGISLHDNPGADLSILSSHPSAMSPLAQSFEMSGNNPNGPLQEGIALSRRSSTRSHPDDATSVRRSASAASHTSATSGVSRSNTLRKQKSLSRKGSVKRSSSRRSVRPGSIGGIAYDDTSGVDTRSVFYTPVPTGGSPTDILANRMQGWRKVLKDLVIYFREVQSSYETRAKAASKVSNTVNSLSMPLGFLQEGGLGEATKILQQYHKQTLAETAKAKEIEHEVIGQLAGLRSDLSQKIKEIKSLSGDFKNNIEKEKEHTKKAVGNLQDALAAADSEAKSLVGKDDPYIVRLHVDRQVERQIDEENYLHRAYLNIENSGRELEAIVVGEIQKAFNAFATILKKEADEAYDTADKLRSGPISLPKDLEWSDFVERDPHFVNPDTPLRKAQNLEYPGKFHPAAAEVRAGMLERKTKYLKSYTPGWFVLSPTHLHEFKSADAVYTQAPLMSLYLQDQKLGTHSQPDSNSHKFITKGRQTGTMHRGHSWVFRAESYDTMLAWYDDIKSLTTVSGEARNAFVRRHTRSVSSQSAKSVSSLDEDEADEIPYQASSSALGAGESTGGLSAAALQNRRPSPGGRFPSDVQIRRDLPPRLSPSDGSEGDHDLGTIDHSAGAHDRGANRHEYFAQTTEKEAVAVPNEDASQMDTGQHPYVPTVLANSTGHHDGLYNSQEIPSLSGQDHEVPSKQAQGAELYASQAQTVSHDNVSARDTTAVLVAEHQSTAASISGQQKDFGAKISQQKGTAPNLARNNTENSVSNYPIPGKYPRGSTSGS